MTWIRKDGVKCFTQGEVNCEVIRAEAKCNAEWRERFKEICGECRHGDTDATERCDGCSFINKILSGGETGDAETRKGSGIAMASNRIDDKPACQSRRGEKKEVK